MVIGFLVFASGGKRMPNKKTIALTLAVSMLAPMLMSCARNSAKDITVKPDDPWYETVRFDLEMDRKPAELVDSSVVTYGNDRLYHLYSLCNLADYTTSGKKASVIIYSCDASIESVYGGGRLAQVGGNANINVNGGTIGK